MAANLQVKFYVHALALVRRGVRADLRSFTAGEVRARIFAVVSSCQVFYPLALVDEAADWI